MNLNKVILIGRATQDPETRALPSGSSVTSFGLATSRFYKDKEGARQEETQFHNIVLFGRLAEIAAQYVAKGSLLSVEGRIQYRHWEGKDGEKRFRTEVVGEQMQLGPRSANTGGQGGSPAPKAQTPRTPAQDNSPDDIPVIEDDDINVKDIPF